MPNPLQEAAVEAIELDAFSKDIPDMIPENDTLYSWFKDNATIIPVSNVSAAGGVTRPSFRVPARVQAGAALAQGTGNADSLGRGTGSQWLGFALSPIFFYNTCEITFLARIATEGRKRGLFNVQAQELKNTFQQAMQGLESMVQGDGSGSLDYIPTTATINNSTGIGPETSSIVGMNNAFQFTDQQVVQFFPSIGGSSRGTATISYTDPVSNTLYFSTALPSGTAVGDYLMLAGSSGAVGASVLGLRAWQVNGNVGTIAGLSRASYPSRLSTPTINMNGGSITLNLGQRALILMQRALGPNAKYARNAIWYTGPDQAMQIANLYYNVVIANAQEVRGDKTLDIAKKEWPDTFAGRRLIVGYNALPGRMDLISADTWYMGEMLPLELYDFGGGITVAPVPDLVNGGYLTSSMFSYVTAFNLANSLPRCGAYITGLAEPTI